MHITRHKQSFSHSSDEPAIMEKGSAKMHLSKGLCTHSKIVQITLLAHRDWITVLCALTLH
jgi:hypothetical protein